VLLADGVFVRRYIALIRRKYQDSFLWTAYLRIVLEAAHTRRLFMTGKNAQSHVTDVIAGAFLIFFGSFALVVRLDLFHTAELFPSSLLLSLCPAVLIALGALLWKLEAPFTQYPGPQGTGRGESNGVNYGK
jgi:hypothetical protein